LRGADHAIEGDLAEHLALRVVRVLGRHVRWEQLVLDGLVVVVRRLGLEAYLGEPLDAAGADVPADDRAQGEAVLGRQRPAVHLVG
jgi:hypothetical protein